MQNIALRRCAEILGKNKDFFYHIKKNNPPFFQHLLDLSIDSMVDGYETYISKVEMYTDRFLPLYNVLENNKKILKFAKYYKCGHQKLRSMGDTIGGKSTMTYKRYLLLQEFIPAMELFIQKEKLL